MILIVLQKKNAIHPFETSMITYWFHNVSFEHELLSSGKLLPQFDSRVYLLSTHKMILHKDDSTVVDGFIVPVDLIVLFTK